MSEPVEGQNPVAPTGEAPAQPAPVAQPVPQVDPAIAAYFDSKMNERISGLQSGYQAQINELARAKAELENQLKISQMTEEEREQQATVDAETYLSDQEKQAALFQIYQSYPYEQAQIMAKMYMAESPDDLAAIIAEIRGGATPPEPAAQVPPVDPNNPPIQPPSSAQGAYISPTGQSYTKEMRRQILKDASDGGRTLADFLRGR